jgi:hypothetical protein
MSTRSSFILVFAVFVGYSIDHAEADGRFQSRGGTAQRDGGGFGAGSGMAARRDRGALAGQRGITGDGDGNVDAGQRGAFTTGNGAQGRTASEFHRTDDGAVDARRDTSLSGDNGSYDRSSSFTRDEDGNAQGQRSTSITNDNTGVSYDAQTSYQKGEGFSRSASCTDASGDTVTCGSGR